MKNRTLYIGGMSCIACQNKIEKTLKAAEGIADAKVSYAAGTAEVTYDPEIISLDRIEAIISKLGYEALENPEQGKPPGAALRAAGLLVIIIAGAMLFDRFGVTLFNAFPTAEAGMELGMLFLIGLLTSVHCVAMCGGINLSQTLGKAQSGRESLRPSLLYNGGRIVSYTITGGIVGALGSAFSLSGRARGIIQLAAGVFMVILGINMLGICGGALSRFFRMLTPRLPNFISAKLDRAKSRSNSPLIIGLLNGLMPCGPLQAMQVFALSTESPVKGALAMLFFSLGTVPLMFALGTLSSFLSSRPAITRRVMTVGACIVAVMGISMVSQGWALSGFSFASLLPQLAQASSTAAAPAPAATTTGGTTEAGAQTIVDGVQIVHSTLSGRRYPAITVQAGIPVKWIINAPQGSINGCNNAMVIPEYNIQYRFKPGENIIEFMPDKTGKFRYSCWMGMIRSTITVVSGSAGLEAAGAGASSAAIDPLAPKAAGYAIPVEEIAAAEPGDYQGNRIQRVAITLTGEGFSPAVVVVESGIPAEWIIDNRSGEEGSAELRVPLYTTILPLKKQGENFLYVQPEEDFDFSTGDGKFFGYMKVVDDISNFDRESVQKEVAAFETKIYPDEYFE